MAYRKRTIRRMSLIILFIGILITILFLARRFSLHTWPWTGI